jgi:hypothetical protein
VVDGRPGASLGVASFDEEGDDYAMNALRRCAGEWSGLDARRRMSWNPGGSRHRRGHEVDVVARCTARRELEVDMSATLVADASSAWRNRERTRARGLGVNVR